MDTKFKSGLEKKREEIQKQLDHFSKQKSAIEILLADYGTVEVTVVETPVSPKPRKVQASNLPVITVKNAVMELINQQPGKWFTTAEIGTFFRQIRNSGTRQLGTKVSENKINTIVLITCKSLVKDGWLLGSRVDGKNAHLFSLKPIENQ